MNEWTRSKSDTTYQPFCGDTPRNLTREPHGHPNGASGTGWSTRWYGWVSKGCLNKFSSTGDATRLWAGPTTAPGARSAKQAFPRTEPSWLNSWTGQWGMKEKTRSATCFKESSQGSDWRRGISWGWRGRKETIGGTPMGTLFIHVFLFYRSRDDRVIFFLPILPLDIISWWWCNVFPPILDQLCRCHYSY